MSQATIRKTEITQASTSDGRLERTAKTRRGFLDAARALILSGALEPTAKQVADLAGVTTRTLFRHFPDLESLHRSLIEESEAMAASVMDEPFTAESWQEGLELLISRRVRVYESLLPLYVSNIWSKYRALSDRNTLRGVKRRRRRLKSILPTEFAHDEMLFEALDGLLSIEYWTSLRRDQQLSVAKAERVVRLAAERLMSVA